MPSTTRMARLVPRKRATRFMVVILEALVFLSSVLLCFVFCFVLLRGLSVVYFCF